MYHIYPVDTQAWTFFSSKTFMTTKDIVLQYWLLLFSFQLNQYSHPNFSVLYNPIRFIFELITNLFLESF